MKSHKLPVGPATSLVTVNNLKVLKAITLLGIGRKSFLTKPVAIILAAGVLLITIISIGGMVGFAPSIQSKWQETTATINTVAGNTTVDYTVDGVDYSARRTEAGLSTSDKSGPVDLIYDKQDPEIVRPASDDNFGAFMVFALFLTVPIISVIRFAANKMLARSRMKAIEAGSSSEVAVTSVEVRGFELPQFDLRRYRLTAKSKDDGVIKSGWLYSDILKSKEEVEGLVKGRTVQVFGSDKKFLNVFDFTEEEFQKIRAHYRPRIMPWITKHQSKQQVFDSLMAKNLPGLASVYLPGNNRQVDKPSQGK